MGHGAWSMGYGEESREQRAESGEHGGTTKILNLE